MQKRSLAAGDRFFIRRQQKMDKLRLTKPLPDIVGHQREQNRLQILPITLPIVLALDNFPLHHRDPFARLLYQAYGRFCCL
jgi:PIN domain nuclease of toxin-antitoxin system